jgi:hypothetical protein
VNALASADLRRHDLPRQAGFARRAALYARFDEQLREQTRFFAAAALINGVFAQLCEVWPTFHSARSLRFLEEAGAGLEDCNRGLARAIVARGMAGRLDHALVHAEQRCLQRHVQAQEARSPRDWEAIRRELNGLLNHRHPATVFSRWFIASRGLSQVLREIRESSRSQLDFGNQSHRVLIGMKLIEHVRAKPYASVRARPSASAYAVSGGSLTDAALQS